MTNNPPWGIRIQHTLTEGTMYNPYPSRMVVQIGACGYSPTVAKTYPWKTTAGDRWVKFYNPPPWYSEFGGHATVGLIVMGGKTCTLNTAFFNHVYSAEDKYPSTGVLGYAQWSPRAFHSVSPTMLLTGGKGSSGALNDVWSGSTSNPTTWLLITSAAPWAARYCHSTAVTSTKVILLGGMSSQSVLKDVWISESAGRDFLLLSCFARFIALGLTACVFQREPDGSLLLRWRLGLTMRSQMGTQPFSVTRCYFTLIPQVDSGAAPSRLPHSVGWRGRR